MTANQMELQAQLKNVLEMYQLQANELETKDNQMYQIMEMFEEHEQGLEDTYSNTPDYTIKNAAYFKLQELRDLRREIEPYRGRRDSDGM